MANRYKTTFHHPRINQKLCQVTPRLCSIDFTSLSLAHRLQRVIDFLSKYEVKKYFKTNQQFCQVGEGFSDNPSLFSPQAFSAPQLSQRQLLLNSPFYCYNIFGKWGCSLAGRAPPLHGGGRGFESPQLHQDLASSFRFERQKPLCQAGSCVRSTDGKMPQALSPAPGPYYHQR